MLLEKTQRRLCRALFVLGCVLPTLAVAGFTTSRLRPGYADDLLLAASEVLGISIECETLTTPRPGVYELSGVRLKDGANKLATCERLRLQRVDDRWLIAATKSDIAESAVASGWLRRLLASELLAKGTLSQISVGSGDLATDIALELTARSDGQRSLRMLSREGAEFHARQSAGGLSIDADTRSSTVPANWLVACPLSSLCRSGDRFTGTTSLAWLNTANKTDASNTVTGSATGRLSLERIDLPGVLASRGTVAIKSLAWSEHRLDCLVGRLELRDGTVSRELVLGACEQLTASPFGPLHELWEQSPADEGIPFSQLACQIELDDQGVTLVAGCDQIDGELRGGALAHSILVLEDRPLLREPATRPLPMQRLVQAFFFDDQPELPATRPAVEFMRALPASK